MDPVLTWMLVGAAALAAAFALGWATRRRWLGLIALLLPAALAAGALLTAIREQGGAGCSGEVCGATVLLFLTVVAIPASIALGGAVVLGAAIARARRGPPTPAWKT